MDHRTHERERPALHGVVTQQGTPEHPPRRRLQPPGRASALVPLLLALVLAALVSAVAGGLVRAGALHPAPGWAGDWMGRAAISHGALMICGFMGTVIGMERAVAVKLKLAWLAPLASSMAALCLLQGAVAWAGALFAVAALAFVGVNLVVVWRQRAPHTLVLLLSALAWLVGCTTFLLRPTDPASVPWWFAFLVMTIAAERLEMTRLMRRRPGAQVALALVLVLMAAGAAAGAAYPRAGGVAFGLSLLLLAAWLGVFDIARRTVRSDGLARYMALCLLGGYAWLAVAGAAWAATALGLALRDVALHALGLGFIVSMMMGHAPVILPAIARIKLRFGNWFYGPLAALHLSLAVRLGLGLESPAWRSAGAVLNAASMALFGATMVAAALAWRRHASNATRR